MKHKKNASTSEASAGLVHSSTSGTAPVALDPVRSRNRRKKCGTITAARLLQEQVQENGFRYRVMMVTLTYALVDSWKPRHISDLLQHYRKYLHRRGVTFRYTWVAELQKRGAVHYHILIWLPKGLTLPKADKQRWWVYGLTRREWTKNAVGYIAKYAGKPDDIDRLPKGIRICGSGGLDKNRAMEKRWWLSPAWVRRAFAISDDPRPVPKLGGYYSRATGEYVQSPFCVGYVDGTLSLQRKPVGYDGAAVRERWRAYQVETRRAIADAVHKAMLRGRDWFVQPDDLQPVELEKSRKRFVDFVTEHLGELVDAR